MSDNIKADIKYLNETDVRHFDGLDWTYTLNANSGEVKGMEGSDGVIKVKIKGPCTRLLTFSIHKYWNVINGRGNHNHNDISYADVVKTLDQVIKRFNIDPAQVTIQNLEIGFNVITEEHPNRIIDQIISLYGRDHSERKEYPNDGSLKGFHISQKIIKIYNKGNQYDLDENILRVEVKYTKNEKIEKVTNGARTILEIMTERSYRLLVDDLLKHWAKIILIDRNFDKSLLNEEEKRAFDNFTNAKMWSEKTGVEKTRFRKEYLRLGSKYGFTKTYNEITEKLNQKAHEFFGDVFKNDRVLKKERNTDMFRNDTYIYGHFQTKDYSRFSFPVIDYFRARHKELYDRNSNQVYCRTTGLPFLNDTRTNRNYLATLDLKTYEKDYPEIYNALWVSFGTGLSNGDYYNLHKRIKNYATNQDWSRRYNEIKNKDQISMF